MSYIKYYLYKKQYSSDGGQTWYDVTPLETVPSGDSIGTYVTQAECECQNPQYRTISGTPYCNGYDKWVDVYLQVSCNGTTWETKTTTPTLVEAQSEDCGYVPPQYKLVATYAGGSTGGVLCDSSTTLTSGNTRPAGHTYTAMTSAVVGDCVTSIGDYAFFRCYGLTGVTMPSGVTSIGDRVFNDCTGLTSAAIPDSVTSIGEYAFANCTGMTSCTIGSGVTSIGYAAFHSCKSLTNIVIPSGVTSMGWGAFAACTGLTSVTIYDGVTTIGEDAFGSSYNIPSITIPDSVTSIGGQAFHNCTGLTSVNIPSGVTSINNNTFYQCYNLTGITIPDSVTSIGAYSFERCRSFTSVTIPSSVTSIGIQAFNECTGLTSITVEATTPPDLGSNQSQFSDTNNCPIYVPCESVEAYKSSWSNYSSRIRCTEQYRTTSGTPYCEGYDKYVDIYSQVSYDGGSTWETTATATTLVEAYSSDCGYVPLQRTISGTPYCDGYDKYVDVYSQVSYDNGTTWITTATTLTLVEAYSEDCGFVPMRRTTTGTPYCDGYDKYVDIYSQVSYDSGATWVTTATTPTLLEMCSQDCECPVTQMKLYAAYSDNTTSSAACNSSTSLSQSEVRAPGHNYSAMTSAYIGDNCVTSIGSSAFTQCTSLTSCTIGSGVTAIYNGAFQRCTSLTGIEVPSGVTTISSYAFEGCSNLTGITINAVTPPTLDNANAFNNTNNCPIYVPCESKQAYKTASYHWTSLSSRIEGIPPCLTPLSFVARYSDSTEYTVDCETSRTVTSATTAPSGYQQSAMTEAIVGDCVTSIGDWSFLGCSSMTACTIGSGTTSIGKYAFYNCSSLVGVTINRTSPPSLGNYAFNGTGSCPIYVPSGSVSSYKSASGWSNYSSRIQAIPSS